MSGSPAIEARPQATDSACLAVGALGRHARGASACLRLAKLVVGQSRWAGPIAEV